MADIVEAVARKRGAQAALGSEARSQADHGAYDRANSTSGRKS